jgi:hypothetical protein
MPPTYQKKNAHFFTSQNLEMLGKTPLYPATNCLRWPKIRPLASYNFLSRPVQVGFWNLLVPIAFTVWLVPDSSAIWLMKCGIRFTLYSTCISSPVAFVFILLWVRLHWSENGTRCDKYASCEVIQEECEENSTLHESYDTWVRDLFYSVMVRVNSTAARNTDYDMMGCIAN